MVDLITSWSQCKCAVCGFVLAIVIPVPCHRPRLTLLIQWGVVSLSCFPWNFHTYHWDFWVKMKSRSNSSDVQPELRIRDGIERRLFYGRETVGEGNVVSGRARRLITGDAINSGKSVDACPRGPRIKTPGDFRYPLGSVRTSRRFSWFLKKFFFRMLGTICSVALLGFIEGCKHETVLFSVYALRLNRFLWARLCPCVETSSIIGCLGFLPWSPPSYWGFTVLLWSD